MATTIAQGSGSTNNNGGSLIKAGNPATDSPISRNVTHPAKQHHGDTPLKF